MRPSLTRYLLIPVAIVAGAAIQPHALGQSPAVKPLTLPVERPGALPALIASARVQDDLRLTSKQRDAVHSLRNRYRNAMRKVIKGTDTSSLASKQAAQRSLAAINSKYNAETLSQLTRPQRARIAEIEHQMLGGHMLLSANVRDQLNLTDTQKVKLANIHKNHQADVSEVNAWYEDGDVSNYERILYLREERQWQAGAMRKVLTKDQRAKFDAMAGESIKI